MFCYLYQEKSIKNVSQDSLKERKKKEEAR